MTNKEILEIAMRQSAIDGNCHVEDFQKSENIVTVSAPNDRARKYLELPLFCDIVSYGSNIVASADEKIVDFIKDYIDKHPIEHCFETPNIYLLNDELQKYGMQICFMAEYFLPDVELLKPQPCEFEIKILGSEDFAELYTPEWSNALCKDRKQLDVLGAAAFDGGKLIGIAGCSADCDTMWQIGVDVLPDYRKKGIACALTSRLACEILERGKAPFYCAAWSNIRSVRNAIKSGFRPAWVELTAKSEQFISNMNK